MPIGVEGQDPLAPDRAGGFVTPTAPPEPTYKAKPFAGDVYGAGVRLGSPIFSVIEALKDGADYGPEDPSHNPLETIGRGSKYDQFYRDEFLGSRNEAQTRAIMQRIDKHEADRKLIEDGGGVGTAAMLFGGLLDPTLFLPIGGAVKTAEGGYSVARSALQMGLLSGLQAGVSQQALNASQPGPHAGDNVIAIASGTLLGGLLGGALGALTRKEQVALAKALDADRTEISRSVGLPAPARAATATAEDAAGAIGRAFSDFSASPAAALDPMGSKAVREALAALPDDVKASVVTRSATTGDELAAILGTAPVKEAPRFNGDAGFQVLARSDAPEKPVLVAVGEGYEAAIPTLEKAYPSVRFTAAADLERAAREELSVSRVAKVESRLNEAADTATRTAGIARSAGAAASDPRELRPMPLLPRAIINAVPPSARQKAADWLLRFSPTQRVFFKFDSLTARRAVADLIPVAFEFEDNLRGIPTAHGGAPAWSQVELVRRRMQMESAKTFRDLFAEYRYGENVPGAPIFRSMLEDARGGGDKLSWDDFKREITKAQWDGYKHEIPQVQRAAEWMRDNVFRPTEKRLYEAGLTNEERLKPRGDDGYATRVWNAKAVAAKRDQFINIVGDWLAGEQTVKAAQRGRMEEAWNERRAVQGLLDRLQQASAEAGVGRVEKIVAGLRDAAKDADTIAGLDAMAADLKAARKLQGEERTAAVQDVLAAATKSAEDSVAAATKRMEDELRAWKGKSAVDALAALKKRDEAEVARADKPGAQRLRGADKAVDRAVKRILRSDRDLSMDELRGRADEIANRLIEHPDGRLPYDVASGAPKVGKPPTGAEEPRGLMSREFAIPTRLVEDFVETDPEHLLNVYTRTLLPDLALHERFGDVNMEDVFRKIADEYSAKSEAAKTEKAKLAVDAERQAVERDVAAIRDRVRGVYGWSGDPKMRQMAEISRVARSYNTITDLGTASLNSMADAAGAIFRWGLGSVFGDAYMPYLSSLMSGGGFHGAASRQAKAMSIAIETDLNLRGHQMADVLESFRPGSKFARGMQWAADKSQLLNGQSYWTDKMKTMATTVAVAEHLRMAERVANGKATEKDIRILAASSIDRPTAERIWQAYSAPGGGEKIDGVHLANTAAWPAEIRDKFEAAMLREGDIAVVTPGHEKPLWLSDSVFSLLGQFKSFTAATHEKVLLAGMQRRDGNTLAGLASAVGLGMLSYKLYSVVSGRKTDDSPAQWVKEGLSRGGVLGWMDEANNSVLAKFSGGKLDMYRLIGAEKPLSRMQQRDLGSALLGPTYGKLQGVMQATGAAFRGDFSAADTSRLRRLLPLQNLWWVRNALNQAEEGVNTALGVPPRPPQP